MKFNLSSKQLFEGLSAVNGAVPSKATLPILETVLFETENGKLKLTATDLEISIIKYVDANIDEDGAVSIPARRLLDALRQLPDIPVHFSVDDEQNIEFTTDKGSYKLVGESADEFPDIPELDSGTNIEMQTDTLQKVIGKTLFAVSNDDLRPAMMGVYFEMGPEESRFVATDGHRLVRYNKNDITTDESINFIVPDKALNLTQKSLHGDQTQLTVTQGHARFTCDDTALITRLINDQYPNYESVIPRDNDKTMEVDREQLLSTVRRVSIFSSSTTRQIRLKVEPGSLNIRAEDIDMSSEANETLECDYNDDTLEIGFNARYLGDVLNNIDDERVQFEFSSPNRAGIVRPTNESEEEQILMLVMPVMLNNYADS